jgi:outer membrane lipoprotein carrier protein
MRSTLFAALMCAAALACTSSGDEGESGGVRVIPPESVPKAPVATVPADTSTPVVTTPVDTPARVTPAGPAIPAPKPPVQQPPPAASEQQRPAQGNDPAAILKRSANAYSNLRSLRAQFSQSLENPLLGRVVQSRGTIAQRRPDRFLMRFTDPDGDVIVSDGDSFWVYYPSVDKKQVFRSQAAAAGGLDLQAQFIGDPTRRFNYTYQGSANVAGRATDVLTLVPKEDLGYKSLKVWLDRQDGLARKFDLTEINGVTRHIELSNLEVNPTLPDALFRFTPPADARIIER